MTDIDSILARIRSGLAGHGRKQKIAKLIGVQPALISRIGHPDWNPTADTIRKLDVAGAQLFPADWADPPHQPD